MIYNWINNCQNWKKITNFMTGLAFMGHTICKLLYKLDNLIIFNNN